MRKVRSDKLKPGMKLGRTVINANEQVLLSAGTILTQKYINKLIILNIPAVYVDDGFLPDVEVEDIISEKTRYQVMQLTKNIFWDFHNNKRLINFKKMESMINDLIEELLANCNIMVNLVDIRTNDEYTFGHSVNTCILSIITAINMGYHPARIRLLAVGAILHDLGKVMVPSSILNKPGKLTEEEFLQIQKHSEYGYDLLSNNDCFSELSKKVVLHHHERFNGSGYPYGLAGSDIHEFSAIVGICDMYDALTADRVYRRAFSTRDAFEMLSASGDYLFDYRIVQAFLQHISAFAVGSLVKLNTGEIGVVVENRPGYSLRPRVRVLFSSGYEPIIYPYEIDLADLNDIWVVQDINDDSELNQLIVKDKKNIIN